MHAYELLVSAMRISGRKLRNVFPLLTSERLYLDSDYLAIQRHASESGETIGGIQRMQALESIKEMTEPFIDTLETHEFKLALHQMGAIELNDVDNAREYIEMIAHILEL